MKHDYSALYFGRRQRDPRAACARGEEGDYSSALLALLAFLLLFFCLGAALAGSAFFSTTILGMCC